MTTLFRYVYICSVSESDIVTRLVVVCNSLTILCGKSSMSCAIFFWRIWLILWMIFWIILNESQLGTEAKLSHFQEDPSKFCTNQFCTEISKELYLLHKFQG